MNSDHNDSEKERSMTGLDNKSSQGRDPETLEFETKLREAIQAVLPTVNASARSKSEIWRDLYAHPIALFSPTRRLIDLLSSHALVARHIAVGQLTVADEAYQITPHHYAVWLVLWAAIQSVEHAILQFREYCAERNFRYHHVIALSGIQVEAPQDLGDDTWLVHWRDVPDSEWKSWVERPPHRSFVSALPDSALILRSKREKFPSDHRRAEEIEFRVVREMSLIRQTATLLPIASNAGCERLTSYIEVDDFQPLLTGGITDLGGRRTNTQAIWQSEWTKRVRELKPAFHSLDTDVKALITRISHRLSAARCQPGDSVEQWINLGIALESFYLKSVDKDEITYRLSMRAARFHDGTIDERLALTKQFKQAYRYRSAAVHSGELMIPAKERVRYEQCFDTVTKELGAAIQRVVKRGNMPDWDRMLLEGAESQVTQSIEDVRYGFSFPQNPA